MAIRGRLDRKLLREFRKDTRARKGTKSMSAGKSWEKRLSSEEFLKFQNEIWKPGPPVRYQTPDKWYKKSDYP